LKKEDCLNRLKLNVTQIISKKESPLPKGETKRLLRTGDTLNLWKNIPWVTWAKKDPTSEEIT